MRTSGRLSGRVGYGLRVEKYPTRHSRNIEILYLYNFIYELNFFMFAYTEAWERSNVNEYLSTTYAHIPMMWKPLFPQISLIFIFIYIQFRMIVKFLSL